LSNDFQREENKVGHLWKL